MTDEQLITQAAAHDDLDDACRVIQCAIGQTDGGIAGVEFSDIQNEGWTPLPMEERIKRMGNYLRIERLYAEA